MAGRQKYFSEIILDFLVGTTIRFSLRNFRVFPKNAVTWINALLKVVQVSELVSVESLRIDLDLYCALELEENRVFHSVSKCFVVVAVFLLK